jgi:phage repressor protein C with HTH and peptisase S24 domain
MEPTLRDGDWLLVDTAATPGVGQLIVARDPRAPGRLIVKRVASADDGALILASDHAAHAGEAIGPVARETVIGRPRLRYWPPRRYGRVG